MEYLVDGYNLLFRIRPQPDDVEATRKELVEFLAKIPLSIRVVFDSHKESGSDLPVQSKRGNLEIIFAPRDLCADRYLLEILSLNKKPKETTLVTSDRPLAFSAKEFGIPTLSAEDFLILAHRKLKKKKGKPLYQESDFEREELRKIFEKRLNDSGS
ncbi:MAG: NYN domain-containing protein [Candidatus Algichlamydia australiensis]|nr:NYN domain-containing protein [Chlamydiales bacterium]